MSPFIMDLYNMYMHVHVDLHNYTVLSGAQSVLAFNNRKPLFTLMSV